MPQMFDKPGPVYLRLGRAGEKRIHDPTTEVILGKPTEARAGKDVLLLTTGGMLPVALEAAEMLEEDRIDAAVVSVHTLKPLDGETICNLASRFAAVITCEEHTVLGGLGGAVAEVLLEAGVVTRFRRFGLPATFPIGVGSQDHMRTVNQLDADSLRALFQSVHPLSAH